MEQFVGYDLDDLALALNAFQEDLIEGQAIRVEICTDSLPVADDLVTFYLDAIAAGHHITMPLAREVEGVAVTSFNMVKGSPALALIVPVLVPLATIGLITFGIIKLENITSAIMPIILASGGIIILGIALLAPRAERVATKYIDAGGRLKYLPSVKYLPKAEHDPDYEDVVEMFCQKCGEKVPSPSSFRSGEHLRRFMITGLCQKCQDEEGETPISKFEEAMEGVYHHLPVEYGIEGNGISRSPLKRLIPIKEFKKQQVALKKLEPYRIIQVHDDGDVTISTKDGKLWVVTREGESFEQKYMADTREYVVIVDGGDTTFREGDTVSVESYERANTDMEKAGRKKATGYKVPKGAKADDFGGHWKPEDFLYLPKTAKYTDYDFAKSVLKGNLFTEDELPYFSGKSNTDPMGISDLIWAKALADMDGRFFRLGQMYVVATNEKASEAEVTEGTGPGPGSKRMYQLVKTGDRVIDMRNEDAGTVTKVYNDWASVDWDSDVFRPFPITPENYGTFWRKKGQAIGDVYGGLQPKTQEEPPKVNEPESKLDFLPDSPEYLAETIRNTGWKEKLDEAFMAAIQRVRG